MDSSTATVFADSLLLFLDLHDFDFDLDAFDKSLFLLPSSSSISFFTCSMASPKESLLALLAFPGVDAQTCLPWPVVLPIWCAASREEQ